MKYKFKVSDGFFHQTFEGITNAKSKKEAVIELKEFYAMELDTTEEYIKIIELVEIEN